MDKTMHDIPGLRIDKWLWTVRLFKTRSQAAEACRKGKVAIDGIPVKPSRIIREGDIISVRRAPSVFTYRVKALAGSRQSASQAVEFLEDLTPEEEKEKSVHKNLLIFSRRDRGTGRPSKRDRRIIDRLKEKGTEGSSAD
jgi:ribosome-associated heat shock protein Hsp15